ncbi:hypothetical protein SprV_0501800200 [Sparganum proliferum]
MKGAGDMSAEGGIRDKLSPTPPHSGVTACTLGWKLSVASAAGTERVIAGGYVNVPVDRVDVRHPSLQQFSPCLIAGSRYYPRAREVELVAFLQGVSGDLRQWVAPPDCPFLLRYS